MKRWTPDRQRQIYIETGESQPVKNRKERERERENRTVHGQSIARSTAINHAGFAKACCVRRPAGPPLGRAIYSKHYTETWSLYTMNGSRQQQWASESASSRWPAATLPRQPDKQVAHITLQTTATTLTIVYSLLPSSLVMPSLCNLNLIRIPLVLLCWEPHSNLKHFETYILSSQYNVLFFIIN